MADASDPSTLGQRLRGLIGQRLAGALVLSASLVGGWLWMDFQGAVDSPLNITAPTVFEIGKGEGLASIARKLQAQGILDQPLWFQALAYTDGAHKRLKFGEYEIPPGTTPRGLLALLTSGKVRQHAITVVEGWTFNDFLAALATHPALSHPALGKPPQEVMTMLGAPGQPPEGQFFPDTYFVTKGTPDVEVLRRAHARMQTELDREWRERGRVNLGSPYEALILASIVEKETARPEERPEIAGVFLRRLSIGMRLQTDPTVIYGLGARYDGNIRKDDLRRDTPYNTYTRSGLPPTPIALPGRASLHAALHPAEGTSLYFVARGDGSHVFSTTLGEHQRAVDQFQRR